jgi:UDP-glucose 4-epimerase
VPTSVQALAALIAELAGKPLDKRNEPPRAGEIRHSLGVPNLANTVLGLPDRVELRTGLAKVLEWMGAASGSDR